MSDSVHILMFSYQHFIHHYKNINQRSFNFKVNKSVLVFCCCWVFFVFFLATLQNTVEHPVDSRILIFNWCYMLQAHKCYNPEWDSNCWRTQSGHLGCTVTSDTTIHSHWREEGKKNPWRVICQARILLNIFGSVVHFVNVAMLNMWQCRFHIGRCFHLANMMSNWVPDEARMEQSDCHTTGNDFEVEDG